MAKNEDDLMLDKYHTLKGIHEVENKLDNSEPQDKPEIFKDFSLMLLEEWRSGNLNPQTVAYCIASKMYIGELKFVEDIDSLMWEAKTLELPYDIAFGSKEEYMYEWKGFVDRIENLDTDSIFDK